MRNGTYYLNNYGSRWVNFTDGKKDVVNVKLPDGKIVVRTVLFYEAFGNFAVTCISIFGKKLTFFQERNYDCDKLTFEGIDITPYYFDTYLKNKVPQYGFNGYGKFQRFKTVK